MIIGIGCDHAAFTEKTLLISYLTENNYTVVDFGCDSNDSVDYPDYAHLLSEGLINKKIEMGILVCGTGIGISIAANKNKGIRAALCCTNFHAEMSRKHNDANIIAFGARVTDIKSMYRMTDIFLNTEFEGGRHLTRVNKIEK
jgi:ribose 5-phosphate isomerase B